MPRYVAFLRGINLGKRRLTMDRLKTIVESLGFENVATFIASGNVIFDARKQAASKLEERIAKGLEEALGYAVDTFVRPIEAVAAIAEAKVFPQDGDEAYAINVSFLKEPLPDQIARDLEALEGPEDRFRVIGSEFYWLRRGRISDSEIWNTPAAKTLRLPTSSMRNLRSLRKLVAKFAADRG